MVLISRLKVSLFQAIFLFFFLRAPTEGISRTAYRIDMPRIKNANEKKNDFVLSDFYAAVFLRSSGLDLIGINKSDPRRFNFIFKDRAGRTKLLDDFFAGRAVVEPRQFTAAIKELKSLMYSDALRP